MPDVFISYARSTEAQARKVADARRGIRYAVWRDDDARNAPSLALQACAIGFRIAFATAPVQTELKQTVVDPGSQEIPASRL